MQNKIPMFLRLRTRPYELLGLMALFLFVLISIPSTKVADITIHDAYFVFEMKNIYLAFSVLLLFTWLIYVVSEKILLSSTLTWIHVITLFFFVSVFLILLNVDFSPPAPPRRYYAITDFNSHPQYGGLAIFSAVVILMMIIGQAVFLINVFGGLLKRIL